MNAQELLKKIGISLTELQVQVLTLFLSKEEIKVLVLTAERSTETLKNYYIKNEFEYLLNDLNFTLKALNHYFGIRKSIDPVIENDSELHITIKHNIDKIITTLNNLTNGTI